MPSDVVLLAQDVFETLGTQPPSEKFWDAHFNIDEGSLIEEKLCDTLGVFTSIK
jgi:hypothetical protein